MIPHNVALSVDETDQMSDLLAAKYIARADELTPVLVDATGVILAARLNRFLYEQRNRPDENETLRDACVLCEGMYLADRVRVDKRNHVVVPCFLCRPRAFTAYHAMIARHEESQEPAPATLRTGDVPDGIERRDPWDLASEELNETVALPREVPAYWGRDRGDYDANDDKSDIDSHDRLVSYPWEPK